MQNRRDFLKTSSLALAGVALAGCTRGPQHFHIGKGDGRMHMKFFPYELELTHTFTVSSYSRKSTPDVQVEIEYEGITGYGEASMPPYLGQSVASVTAFLEKVDLSQFADPFQLEDILSYIDGLSEGDSAAKAAVDIALHDLVGKLIGQPWYRLWGLDAAKAPSTTYTIGIDTPEVVKEKTLEAAGRFNILKVKVGLDSDQEMIRTIRSVMPIKAGKTVPRLWMKSIGWPHRGSSWWNSRCPWTVWTTPPGSPNALPYPSLPMRASSVSGTSLPWQEPSAASTSNS